MSESVIRKKLIDSEGVDAGKLAKKYGKKTVGLVIHDLCEDPRFAHIALHAAGPVLNEPHLARTAALAVLRSEHCPLKLRDIATGYISPEDTWQLVQEQLKEKARPARA